MPTPPAEIRSSLERHNKAFETLINLIPAQYYLPPSEEEISSKFHKNKKEKAVEKQRVKEASRSAKRDKFDPAKSKTTVQLHQGVSQAQAVKDRKGKRKAVETSEESEDDNPRRVADEQNTGLSDGAQVPMQPPSGIEDLRAKLHAKMATLKKGPLKTHGVEDGDKDKLLEERRRQRAEMRERRRKETKEKIRRERELKGNTNGSTQPTLPKDQLTVTNSNAPMKLGTPNAENAFANVAFSNISTSHASSKKKSKHNLSSNPTHALALLQKRSEKLSSLTRDKREEVEQNQKWEKAAARMVGTKVRDDESKLKKAAKRKEKEKTKSKKEWDERKTVLAASMAAKAKKREDNIALKHERRKGKGKSTTVKKARPGFEGKRFSGKQSMGKLKK